MSDPSEAGLHAGIPPGEAVEAEILADDFPDRYPSPREIGPGMWEALGWIAVISVFDIVASNVWAFFAVMFDTALHGPSPFSEYEDLIARQLPYMLGAIKFVELAGLLAAIRWRFGPAAFRLTGFRTVPAVHLVIVALVMLPVANLAGQLYAVLMIGWEWLAQFLPFLTKVAEWSSIELLKDAGDSAPWIVLVFSFAAMPALTEEFVFRGLIGRGLVGRYGIVAGVCLTSMLFAAVHISPVHALALVPLAVVLHVAYLSSGSIWLPVLIHFVNNALSVSVMVYWSQLPTTEANPEASPLDDVFDPAMLVASACCVTSAVWLLWRLRMRWMLPDGGEWLPRVPGVAAPPPELNARRVLVGERTAIPAVVLVVGLLLFTLAYGMNILRIAEQAGEIAGR